MEEKKIVRTCYIGNQDPYEWLLSEDGKATVMPELLIGCEEILYTDVNEVRCVRIESFVRRKHNAFDFNVRKKDVADTLEKIMEWGLQEEEYLICERVKNLQEYIDKQNRF